MLNNYQIQITPQSSDYELIDSGDGEKLERYGEFVLCRPDPQALWHKAEKPGVWNNADARFIREGEETEWRIKAHVPAEWPINYGGETFIIRPTSFKHLGIFPEQINNWTWMRDLVKKAKRPVNVLNLFGYTGGASMVLARAGASVCHLDGSKKAVAWARENAAVSGLDKKPVRWIIDDAMVFAEREIRRGNKYDGILLDPPSFGHGPKGETWKIEADFLKLIDLCGQLLSDQPLFVLVNGYVAGYSAISYANCLIKIVPKNGEMEIGELTILDRAGRLLPSGIYARWRGK